MKKEKFKKMKINKYYISLIITLILLHYNYFEKSIIKTLKKNYQDINDKDLSFLTGFVHNKKSIPLLKKSIHKKEVLKLTVAMIQSMHVDINNQKLCRRLIELYCKLAPYKAQQKFLNNLLKSQKINQSVKSFISRRLETDIKFFMLDCIEELQGCERVLKLYKEQLLVLDNKFENIEIDIEIQEENKEKSIDKKSINEYENKIKILKEKIRKSLNQLKKEIQKYDLKIKDLKTKYIAPI